MTSEALVLCFFGGFDPGEGSFYCIKISRNIDPAVGSGAFPMGMLNELYACRHVIEQEMDPVEIKKQIVRDNIYGVDIEKGAVDIARLRFWLAIIVDETEPLPLPNLDYKIMQGNSLLESFEGIDLSNLLKRDGELFDDDEIIKHLVCAIDGFYMPNDQMAKAKIRKQISEKVIQLLKERQLAPATIKKLEAMDLHANGEFFLWHTWFNDVFSRPNDCNGGFDIVIGNPPYVEARNSSFSEKLKDSLQIQIEAYYSKEEKKCFPRGADLLIFFFELSFRLLNSSGINSFITENSWLSTDYGKEFQNYLLKNINVQGIIDSDFKYFETADINTVISFFKKKKSTENNSIQFFHCHANFETHPCNTITPEKNDFSMDCNILHSDNPILKKYKWGFLYSTNTKLISLLEKMVKLQNQKFAEKIAIGQGLNITKDKILHNPEKDSVPYFISDNGSAYCWDSSKTFVSKKVASPTRKIPLLILPRGLGTHFCCMNETEGFSSSYVEIYENEILTEAEKLRLWLFCNSSLLWVLREYTGRCNLGGGMLKAEATDLKSIPLCFDLENITEIKSIYLIARSQKVPSKIEDAINSEIHKRIDKIVFDYFDLPLENNFVVDMLIERFNWRGKKSKK